MSLPFGLSLPGLVEQIFKTAGGYPYLSVNAWNPWALVTFGGSGIAQNRAWVCDMVVTSGDSFARCAQAFSFGPIPAVVVGTALTLAVFIAVSLVVARRPDRRTMLVGLAVLAIAFFVVPTRVHERYLFPLVALGAILAAVSVRWTIAYVLSGLATLANMYFVLTTLYPSNPGIDDWLGIGPALGSWAGVAIAAVVQVAVFAFALSELRASASARLAREIAASGATTRQTAGDAAGSATARACGRATGRRTAAGGPARRRAGPVAAGLRTAGGLVAAAAGRPGAVLPAWESRPSSGEIGFVGWFRARLGERPIRPDRTAGARAGARRPPRPARPVDDPRPRGRASSPAGSGGSASRTRCTSTRSTTRGRPWSSSRPGATGSPTTSTSGPTPTSRSTRWPSGSWPGARTGRPRRASSASRSVARPWSRAGTRPARTAGSRAIGCGSRRATRSARTTS